MSWAHAARWNGYRDAIVIDGLGGLNTPRRLETLGQMLADKGHSATRIEKILGGNLVRVFEETLSA